jgi:hypothetical protein
MSGVRGVICKVIALMLLFWLSLPASATRSRSAAATAQRDSDYIFVGPKDAHWREFYNENGIAPRVWTAKEKAIFGAVLSKVRAKHPEFFARAVAACRPLGLLRRNLTADDNNDPRGRAVCMLTSATTIEVDESFFTTPAKWQYHSVIHELAHLLDTACILSASKDWIAIAQPRIARVRKAYGNNPFAPLAYSDAMRGEELAKKAKLPSLDAAENFPECFAECVAFYFADGPRSVSADVRKYITTRVLAIDPKVESARKLYVAAEWATSNGEYDRAFHDLNTLLVQNPDMLDVHASRARIWGFKHDFEMMEYEANQELALLRRRKIPQYHWTYDRVRDLLDDAHDKYGFDRVQRRAAGI